MRTEEVYLQKDDETYIRVEPTEVAREIQGMTLLIEIAEEKVKNLKSCRAKIDPDALGLGQDEINDIEMAIDDLKVYLGRLKNIPRRV